MQSMHQDMTSSMGTGLTSSTKNDVFEVRGQLPKKLHLCGQGDTTECLHVNVNAKDEDHALVEISTGAGAAEEGGTKRDGKDGEEVFYRKYSSTSSEGENFNFEVPFKVTPNSERKAAYNPKDGTFSFQIHK